MGRLQLPVYSTSYLKLPWQHLDIISFLYSVMNSIKADNLACPMDGERLTLNDKQLVCQNGHGFDLARQGYVNLLPVQHKRSKQPGDSKKMVLARAEFLNSGLYQPIADKLAEIASSLITDDNETCLMDAGCGEGYYFDYVFNYLKGKKSANDLSFIGLDISKAAITESTKRNKQITWAVGTNRQPPIYHASVDIILCVFGFKSFAGFTKVLKPGGKIVLVEPGADHLKELREIIYSEVKKSDPQDLAHLKDKGFTMVDSQQLQFKTSVIGNKQINNLLIMTPHFYRATKEGRAAASRLQKLDLTVDIVFRTLAKMGE